LKSFKRKGGRDQGPPDDPDNPTVNFHNEIRSNGTHERTTDPEARLTRKGAGKEAKLAFCGNALMENRNGFLLDIEIRQANGFAEREGTLDLLRRQARKKVRPQTVGADRGYHTKDFVARLRRRGIAPHIACIGNRATPGLDGRTTRRAGYARSQRSRKRIEEIFG
jgi:hypothetical protein